MTPGELTRALESKQRVERIQAKERAYFDYTLADLIGWSFARTQHAANKMPDIMEAYPTLFDEEDRSKQELERQKQEKTDELSVLRFKLFVNAHNKKFNKEAANT